MLHLTARNILHKAKHAIESGPARTTAIITTAGGVGLIAGKREDARKVPIAALVGGAGLKFLGFHTLGDGAMSGGATMLGYRMGARMARKAATSAPASPALPAGPRPAVARGPQHPQHRRRG